MVAFGPDGSKYFDSSRYSIEWMWIHVIHERKAAIAIAGMLASFPK